MRVSVLLAPLVAAIAGLLCAPHPASANAELDRKYALETIGALRSWDNVDGLFADYVAGAYKDFFATQTRFRYQDLSKADAVFSSSKLPYAKAIEDPEILGSLARALRVQSLVRTRILKEGPRYRFTIDWLHSPMMDVLATETFSLEDSGSKLTGGASDGSEAREFAGLGDIKGHLQKAMLRLFAKVPFVGQVTGRDNDDVTVNLGAATGVHRGDQLVIGTIEEVKKHPLLKEIVEWRIVPTGRIEIDSVDEALSFGHVLGQEEGHEIARYQKVLRVEPKAEPTPGASEARPGEATAPDPLNEPPKLGFASASLWTGGYSRSYSSQAQTLNGGGFLYGARGEGQVWLNRQFFVDLSLGFGAFGYSQSDSSGNSVPAGGGGSELTVSASLGYIYLLSDSFFGPRAWAKAGFLSDSTTLPLNAAASTSPYSVKSAFLGIGGDLPVRDNYGAELELDFGVFNFGDESGGSDGAAPLDGPASSSHNALFYLGGYYRYRARICFKLGLEFQVNGSSFNLPSTVSQQNLAILPAVQYLF